MNDEEKKERLMRYLIAVDRLRLKCDDAARWESLSLGPTGVIRTRNGSSGPDEIKEMAIHVRQECESLAVEVRGRRKELDEALNTMQNERLRGYLESKYINGMSDKELREKNHYSERYMRSLINQAIRELDRCSSYFS